MHIWLSQLPAWVGLLIFTAVPAVVAVFLHALFRRVVSPSGLLPHHEVAGFLIAVVGVIYAVVLGFLVVTVWVAFDDAQRTADLEAGDVAELFSIARAFPQPVRSRLQTIMADYAFEVRDREWPMLVHGEQDMRARSIYNDALPVVGSSSHKSGISTVEAISRVAVEQTAFTVLHSLSEHRRERLIAADSGLPAGLYFTLIVGALMVVAFVFLFGVDNQTLQLTMTALIVGIMGLLIGVIVEVDRPYSGAIRVSPQAWTLVIRNNDLARYRTHTAAEDR